MTTLTRAAALLVVAATTGLAATAQAQAPADPQPVTPAPPATAAPPVTAAPPAAAPPAAAPPPEAPAPRYAPQPGYPAPVYAPPPGYPPPGYAPPPGYPPPGYPPPGYPPPGYAPPPGYYAPPSTAYARRAGFQTHDGAYIRLHIGGGYTSMSANDGGGNLKISGGSVSIGFAAGGAITENLILFGTVTGTSIGNPDVSSSGMSIGTGNGTADIFGIGGGLAYYLEPVNIYFAGSLLASQIEIDDTNGNKVGESEFGIGFEGLVGKEWWVSDNWGLGIAGQLMLASMKDKDTFGTGAPPTWKTGAFSLLFSATFN